MLPSLIFIVVSTSPIKFSFTLLYDPRPSRAPTKDATGWWGSDLQRKLGSFTRFDEMDTDIGTRFAIHVVVSVFLNVSYWAQIVSESNTAKLPESFWWLVYSIPKESSSSNRVSVFDKCSLDKRVLLVHYRRLYVVPNWMSCWRVCHK